MLVQCCGFLSNRTVVAVRSSGLPAVRYALSALLLRPVISAQATNGCLIDIPLATRVLFNLLPIEQKGRPVSQHPQCRDAVEVARNGPCQACESQVTWRLRRRPSGPTIAATTRDHLMPGTLGFATAADGRAVGGHHTGNSCGPGG